MVEITATFPDRESARAISRMLIEDSLIACAQIDEVESIYTWEGKIESDLEFRLVLKSVKRLAKKIEEKILSCHPYTLPQIVVVECFGSREYEDWVEESCKG